MKRVLVAFDKFKGALSAPAACGLAAELLLLRCPDWTVDTAPLTDGGEGFAEVLTQAVGGTLRRTRVSGPRQLPATAAVGWVDLAKVPAAARGLLALPDHGSLAVVEMAQASGLQLLETPDRNPWRTSSRGTGELLLWAAREGASAILLGVGGSATNDVGLGALEALGIRLLDRQGEPMQNSTPADWDRAAGLFGRLPDGLPPIRVACDVTNPLIGPQGATMVFGPQKGLSAAEAGNLEVEVRRIGSMLCAMTSTPLRLMEEAGMGAAGGIAFGLRCVLGDERLRLVSGFSLLEAWTHLLPRLAAADLVVTGEGRFDETSLQGKGPGGLVRVALAAGKEAWVLAGSVSPGAAQQLVHRRLRLRAISPPEMPLPRALRACSRLLFEALDREVANAAAPANPT